jgi:Tol biopolymer transport system component
MIGQRLGPYEITAKLGEGGMGEVYRATDSKLKREVAIKVLPAAFTADPERLARFEREAQLLAQLHHPHIASIFGLEESGGTRALVMELVEGPTLQERLGQRGLPLEEVVAIGRQIAEALEAAHEKGIVHRDLKPQNVKLAANGAVKVLDFGLAKAMDPAAKDSGPASMTNLAASPTMTLGATQMGVILGTAAYMAPEQARGGAVDKRADIWAFGVVLYELLSGRMAFAAPTVPDTLAAVLTRPLDWSALPASTPPALRELLRRCLERDPKNRLRDIGEARIALGEGRVTSATLAGPAIPDADRGRARALPWAVAILAIAIAAGTLWRGTRPESAPPGVHGVTRLELSLPAGVEPVTRVPAALAVSPNGRKIAMVGFRAGQRRLYLRALDSGEAIEIQGAAGVNAMAFSPDGESVVYVPGGSRVVRASLADQQSVVVSTCADLRNSLAWGASHIHYRCNGEIWRVPAAGGEATRLTRFDTARREVLHSDPIELPGGRELLFASLTEDEDSSRVEVVSIADGARRVVVDDATSPVLSPTGHLLFEREGALWAVAFDVARAELSGRPAQILPATALASPLYGSLGVQLSPTGTLVYMPRGFDEKRVVSVTRDGTERAIDIPTGSFGIPRVSGDGRRLLLERGRTLEALDFERGTRTQIARDTFGTSFANWTSDDRKIVYRRHATPVWIAADGSGRGGPVPEASIHDYVAPPGPDADSMLVVRIQPGTSGDILLFSLSGAFPVRTLVTSPAYEGGPELSPDRRWLVYQSNESGEPEIYVRAYPGLERAWQVSEGGGAQTRWSRDGREIYYRSGGRFMAAAFDGRSSEPRLGRPVALFADEYDSGPGITSPNYDVMPDGRFILFRAVPTSGRVQVVLDWLPELERSMAAEGVR